MWRFLKYSYTLPLCLLLFCCKQVQQEEREVMIPFTQDDITQIYSLAFDSLLGRSDRWLDAEPVMVNDSVVVEVIFSPEDEPHHFTDRLFSEERYTASGKDLLKKYDGFEEERFREIIADSTWKFYKIVEPGSLNTSFKYKLVPVLKGKESYYPGDTLGAVWLNNIAFNKSADHAIAVVLFTKDPDWGFEKAYFFTKENDKWRVVGQNSLLIW
ncbi:hypothetical protein C8N40_10255 [Pontibacter mucosus]|uniref:Uncharacterized protein n=1 Tax=Pontibacter mucosus TaxID=1649266 RepID=A0A2T5YP49_9BACT|nr:hypothetical protein C8N40_10255 [Pontibacter mucosus]